MQKEYDVIIIGAGIYGLYLANKFSSLKKQVLVLEIEKQPFMRASYINQARVHKGYHYPRSLSTAKKSFYYYEKFNHDFSFAINNKFQKIYALSNNFSYTSAKNFLEFCKAATLPVEEIATSKYFNSQTIERAFLCNETSFDATLIANFLSTSAKDNGTNYKFNTKISSITLKGTKFYIETTAKDIFSSVCIINASYANVNQILTMLDFKTFNLKYEICEIILCNASDQLAEVGITVMDGPFFSLMPFGLSNYHSLSAVKITPHLTSYENKPTFSCQAHNQNCNSTMLDNCNFCVAKPETDFIYMQQLTKTYLKADITLQYEKSLFTIKPVLKNSEIDDSRPTIIKQFSNNPIFISVLSGKINTIYDLDEILL